MKFVLLINLKLLTIANYVLLHIPKHEHFSAHLKWAWKKLYNLWASAARRFQGFQMPLFYQMSFFFFFFFFFFSLFSARMACDSSETEERKSENIKRLGKTYNQKYKWKNTQKKATIAKHRPSQLAFFVNLHRAVIGPSATLTGRWRPDIDLRRMLTGLLAQIQMADSWNVPRRNVSGTVLLT